MAMYRCFGCDEPMIANMKKRITKLEAEVAKLKEAARAFEKELREVWDYEDKHIAELVKT